MEINGNKARMKL